MPTQHEHRQNTAIVARSLGRLPFNATPAQEQALYDSMTDQEISDMCDEWLTRMGADGYHQPAAA